MPRVWAVSSKVRVASQAQHGWATAAASVPPDTSTKPREDQVARPANKQPLSQRSTVLVSGQRSPASLEAVGERSRTAGCLPCNVRVRSGGADSDMWTAPQHGPRTHGSPFSELATYREYLGRYRLTTEMRCEGLDAGQLAGRSVPPATLGLVGLVRHLAQTGNHWLQRVLQGRADPPRLYRREADPDWDFAGATCDPAVVKNSPHAEVTQSVMGRVPGGTPAARADLRPAGRARGRPRRPWTRWRRSEPAASPAERPRRPPRPTSC